MGRMRCSQQVFLVQRCRRIRCVLCVRARLHEEHVSEREQRMPEHGSMVALQMQKWELAAHGETRKDKPAERRTGCLYPVVA